MTALTTSRGIDWAVAALLGTLAVFLYWPMFGIRPLETDNLYALAWVDAMPVRALFAGDPQIYPEWRPLPYLSLWLEHRVVPVRAVAGHYAVNLALWVCCAWLVHRIVFALSGSRLAGVLASVLLLTDLRATWALIIIIERQTTMACLFGLVAILVAMRGDTRVLRRSETVALMGLLIASALSKEYGLAFAIAVGVSAVVRRRRDLAWPAAVAIGAYGALRLAATGGATAAYCEDMYFFFERTRQCLDPTNPTSLVQMAYNALASTTNLVFQGLLSEQGRPVFGKRQVLTSAVLLVPIALALAKGSTTVRMMAVVLLANGLLSFAIYRDRNQLIGGAAASIVIGVGLAIGRQMLRGRGARHAATALIVVLLCVQAAVARRLVAEHGADVDNSEPCQSIYRDRPFAKAFITRVKITYGLDDPYCLGKYEN